MTGRTLVDLEKPTVPVRILNLTGKIWVGQTWYTDMRGASPTPSVAFVQQKSVYIPVSSLESLFAQLFVRREFRLLIFTEEEIF